jgi:ATP-dependent DNA helicase RecG
MPSPLSASIQYLKGIGPKRARLFSKLGVNTIEDLLYYFPRRYEDRTNFSCVAMLKEGNTYTIKAKVLARTERRSFRRRAFSITEVAVGDDTGKICCVWFNQPYLKDYFSVGQSMILHAKVERYAGRLQMSSPEFEILDGAGPGAPGPDDSLDMGRIVPVYSVPEGMTQRYLRKVIKYALDEYLPTLNDFLPYDIRSRNNLLNLAKSLVSIHYPGSSDLQKQAYERLSFEEFFLFQLPLALRRLKKEERPGIAHKIEGQLVGDFINGLPFRLTAAQAKVVEEIKSDMARPQAMQRLLQGDVGSGKTVVATIAAMLAIQGGYQVAFMVPTEILARQHFQSVMRHASCVMRQKKEIKIGLLTSGLANKEKQKIYQEIRDGKIDLIIGTHALLETGVEFKNLGLVVIDEQHKFGVGQRALLPRKGLNPDVLIMTATPIPRTLAITLYGDLDISVINELPPGRLPIKTMHYTEDEKSQAYSVVKEQLAQGRQAYIVYPVIDPALACNGWVDIAGAKKMYAQLKAGEFRDFKVGLIHGQLKQREQDEVMHKFAGHKIDVLISTTILEVGIDMPNATCMIVEDAQRFGLSQLHQLRGRVGRSSFASFCILISDLETEESKARIGAMVSYGDGFRIAEEDLRIRGPGEFFGRRQHGLTELRIANPLTQMQLLKRAREEAIKLISADRHLGARPNIPLKEKLLQRFPEYEKLVMVG